MTGQLYINGMDAYTTWGITMDPGALAALMTPPPMKEVLTSGSRLSHGQTAINNAPRKASRDLTLAISLQAPTEAQFLSRYTNFCNQLATGELTIRTAYQPDVYYRTIYKSCQAFSQYRRGIAKFTLKLTEPDPTNRQSNE